MQLKPVGVCSTRTAIRQVIFWTTDLPDYEERRPLTIVWMGRNQVVRLFDIEECSDALSVAWVDQDHSAIVWRGYVPTFRR